MDLFDIVINLIESILIIYFVFRYYKIKSVSHFTILTAIVFIEEMISHSIDEFNYWMMFIIAITLILYQCVYHKNFSVNYIFIGTIPIFLVLFCNITVLLFFRIIQIDASTYINQAIIVSKLSCLIVMYFLSRKMNIKNLKGNGLWLFNGVILMLMLLITIDTQHILAFGVDDLNIYFRIVMFIVLIVMLFKFLDNFIKYSDERVKFEFEQEKIKYKEKNEKDLSDSKAEIDKLQHNLKYILMSVILYMKAENYDAVIEHTDKYLGRVTMADHCIVTNHPYFDYIFNSVSLKYKRANIHLKKTIVVPEESVLDKTENADIVISILEETLIFVQEYKISNVDIMLEEDNNWCFVKVIIPCEMIDTSITEYFSEDITVNIDEEAAVVYITYIIEKNI